VSPPGTVGGDERIRLFCAVRLPEEVLERLAAWQHEAFGRVPDVRIVARENLHVTLAFLGHRPVSDVAGILAELRAVARRAAPIVLEAPRYRETRSVGMLAFADVRGAATALAFDLHRGLERAGVYRPEKRRWLPHVTVLRFRQPPQLDVEPPDLGPVSPSDAALYHSVLRSGGAQYEVVDAFALYR
jgi:2'-5' RNA ligase